LTGTIGPRRALRPELLFEALHREAVDYVVIGGFAMGAYDQLCPTADIDLAIARTIENCTALTEVLCGLDAYKTRISPNARRPLERRRGPTRILDARHVFDTLAGGIDLHLPRYVLGCPPYPELRAASTDRPLGDGLKATVASLDHLTQMRDPFKLIDAWSPMALRTSCMATTSSPAGINDVLSQKAARR